MTRTCSDFNFSPSIGLGPIRFGTLNPRLIEDLNATIYEEDSVTRDVSYEIEAYEIIFSSMRDEIYGITAWDCFFFKGVNLIGLSLHELNKLLFPYKCIKAEVIEFDIGTHGILYDCDELGLGFCLESERVTFASCHDTK